MNAGNDLINWKLTVADLISTGGIIIAVLLAWWQLRKANIQNRAQFIVNQLREHTADPESLNILYKIEYQQWKYDEVEFAGSSDEQALDKIPYSFEQISLLYEMGTISRRDMRLIEYDFLRVYSDGEVQKYFRFLDRTPHGLPTDAADFRAYRRVAKKLIKRYQSRKSAMKLVHGPLKGVKYGLGIVRNRITRP